jgi:hypothetical protein
MAATPHAVTDDDEEVPRVVRFKRRPNEAPEDTGPRPVTDRFTTRETAAGVFSRPPTKPPPPPPPPRPEQHPEQEPPRHLSVRPLRTPAPAVTRIRVEAVPVEGFEYETAAPWCNDPPQTLPPPAPRPAPPPPRRPLFAPLAPKPAPRTINWLDE